MIFWETRRTPKNVFKSFSNKLFSSLTRVNLWHHCGNRYLVLYNHNHLISTFVFFQGGCKGAKQFCRRYSTSTSVECAFERTTQCCYAVSWHTGSFLAPFIWCHHTVRGELDEGLLFFINLFGFQSWSWITRDLPIGQKILQSNGHKGEILPLTLFKFSIIRLHFFLQVDVSIPAGAPIIEVFLLDYGEIRVTSLNCLFAIDESQPFKYLPATALLCKLDKMQPSPPYFLKSSNFFFGQSTNLTAVFHALCEHESTKLSNVIYPQYHVTLLKTQITSRFSRIFDIRPLLPRSPLTAQSRQNLLHSSMSSVSVAATPPSYRAASRLPTRSRFVPYQNPVMATSALKHRTSSPQITPRPPRITRFRRYFMD